MGDLFSERWQVVGFVGYVVALVLLSSGALAGSAAWVRAGALTLLASLSVFGMNLASMLGHLWRPRLRQPERVSKDPPAATAPEPIES